MSNLFKPKAVNEYEDDFDEYEDELNYCEDITLNRSEIPIQKIQDWTSVPQKRVTRYADLKSLIPLSVCIFDVLEIKPKSLYDLYRRNRNEIMVQATPKIANQLVQTTNIKIRSRWTQAPAETLLDSGLDGEEKAPLIAAEHRRLNAFIDKTGSLMCTLLEERQDGIEDNDDRELVVDIPSIVDGSVTLIQCNSVILYIVCAGASPGFPLTKSSITLWRIGESKPRRRLLCYPKITCMEILENSIVIAGTQDGSIQIWNLSEDRNWPIFTTDSKLALQFGSIKLIILRNDALLESIDAEGSIQSWILLRENGIRLQPASQHKIMNENIDTCLSNRRGLIISNGALKLYAKSKVCFPPEFKVVDLEQKSLLEIMTMVIFLPDYFLIGCRDGLVALFFLKQSLPIARWTLPTSVMQIVCSAYRSAVFYASDIAGSIYSWDLLEDYNSYSLKLSPKGKVPSALAVTRGQSSAASFLVIGRCDGSISLFKLSTVECESLEDEELLLTALFNS